MNDCKKSGRCYSKIIILITLLAGVIAVLASLNIIPTTIVTSTSGNMILTTFGLIVEGLKAFFSAVFAMLVFFAVMKFVCCSRSKSCCCCKQGDSQACGTNKGPCN